MPTSQNWSVGAVLRIRRGGLRLADRDRRAHNRVQMCSCQSLHHLRLDGTGLRVGPPVLEFSRVISQIIELADLDAVNQAEAPVSVANALHARLWAYARIDFLMFVLDERRFAAIFSKWRQYLAFHAHRGLNVRPFEYRTADVQRLPECIRVFAGWSIGISPDKRYTRQLLVLLRALEEQFVISQVVAVVAREDLYDLLPTVALIHRCVDASDGVVDHRDHPAGQRLCFPRFAR